MLRTYLVSSCFAGRLLPMLLPTIVWSGLVFDFGCSEAQTPNLPGLNTDQAAVTEAAATRKNPLQAERAYGYLKQICELGPRPAGSQGMRNQQELLKEFFTELGGKVELQRFRARHPLRGTPVEMANLIVRWHPERSDRILLCAHYDTRPRPDNEGSAQVRASGVFIGANDGASGVAVLMELAHLMPKFDSKWGVDFVLFDAEELVYGGSYVRREQGQYFLGSTWFARQYVKEPPPFKYRWGILLDMVGDKDLTVFQERNSIRWQDTRPLVHSIWSIAAQLGVSEFIPRAKYLVRDDHLPLHNIAKIPTCDIIDFEYPDSNNRYWHSVADTPDKCSGESLAKVGWVVYEWLLAMP